MSDIIWLVVAALVIKEWLPVGRRRRDKVPTQPHRAPSGLALSASSPASWDDAACDRLLKDLRHPERTWGKITSPVITGTDAAIADQLIAETTGYPRRSER